MKVTDLHRIADGRLQLTRFGLGCGALAGLYKPTPEPDARATLQAAWDAGLRYFDTAPFYGHTRSEHRVGAFLREQPRDAFVVSTKVGRLLRPDASVRPMDNGWADPLPFRPHWDYSFGGVMRSFEDSLQRLGLERIDILFVHDIGRFTHGESHAPHWHALTQGGGSAPSRPCGATVASGPTGSASTRPRWCMTACRRRAWTARCSPAATRCWSSAAWHCWTSAPATAMRS